MKAKITDKFLASLKPTDKPESVHDAALSGFKATVMPSGRITFQLSYRNADGRRQTFTIGKFGDLTTAQARAIAGKKIAEVRSGIDVHAAKKEHRAKADALRQQTLNIFFEQRYEPFITQNLRGAAEVIGRIKAHFLPRWGELPLSEINHSRVDIYVTEMLERGLQNSSINRPLSYLRSMLNRAASWGVIESSPLTRYKLLKEDRQSIVRYLNEDEYECLLAALDARQERHRTERLSHIKWSHERRVRPPEQLAEIFTDYLKPLVVTALNTGLRRGELFSLRWIDVNLAQSFLTVRGAVAKSAKTRHVPLSKTAHAVLSDWFRQADKTSELVFPSPAGGGAQLSTIKKSWANVLEAARIEGFRFHDLRHTFASWLVMRGASIFVVKELLGHSTIDMTMRYAHLAPSHKSDAVALLN